MSDNEMIAQFMGMEFGDDGTMCYDDAENRHPPTPTDMLAFHTSWDWLMPIVCRIDDLFGDDDDIDDQINKVHNAVLKFDIEIVHRAVVEFIKAQKL